MRRVHLLCAGVLVISGWASMTNAQTDRTKPATPQAQPPAKTTEKVQTMAPFCHKVGDILGSKVVNPRGEDLGKVEELVLDPHTGTIGYAVVSFGGFLGMGDRLFAMPFSLFTAPMVDDDSPEARFTLNIDKAKLEKAPGFPKDNWPDIHSPQWGSTVDSFYGARPQEGVRAVDKNASLHLCKASELIGQDIHNNNKDELGEIKELVLDPQRARVNYFVLSSGGFLGMGDRLIAVPWEGLKVTQDGRDVRYVLALPKERLQGAPQFDEKDWRRMSDPAWIQELYTYYAVRPYWMNVHPTEASAPGQRRPTEGQ